MQIIFKCIHKADTDKKTEFILFGVTDNPVDDKMMAELIFDMEKALNNHVNGLRVHASIEE